MAPRKARLGIMQGRLVPPIGKTIQAFPRERWRDELPFAAAAGLSTIEWIHDLYGADVNPLLTDAGNAELQRLTRASGVEVRSVCADYFMDRPFVRVSDADRQARVRELDELLHRAARVGASRVVLPFVDASRIETEEDTQHVVASVQACLPTARALGVELHLETSLDPEKFAALLARMPDALVKVNYDAGNSASLGYAPSAEFAAYGPRVGSVHIKDRVLGGTTVALGTGNTDFPALFRALEAHDYAGDFILQVARGEPGDEVAWARRNRTFVAERWPLVPGPGAA